MDKASTEFECKERMSSSVSRMLEALPSRLLDEMGSILRRYNLLPSRGIEARVSFIPQVDIIEDDQSIRVDAELPGVDEKDIDITLTPDTLTISGEKKRNTSTEQKISAVRSARSVRFRARSLCRTAWM